MNIYENAHYGITPKWPAAKQKTYPQRIKNPWKTKYALDDSYRMNYE